MKNLINAFRSPAMPVNPVPFAQAIIDGVRSNGSGWINTDECKALLWVLNSQSFGQLATIDQVDEWGRLNVNLKKEPSL